MSPDPIRLRLGAHVNVIPPEQLLLNTACVRCGQVLGVLKPVVPINGSYAHRACVKGGVHVR